MFVRPWVQTQHRKKREKTKELERGSSWGHGHGGQQSRCEVGRVGGPSLHHGGSILALRPENWHSPCLQKPSASQQAS